jgi:hypothetical protein
MGRRNRERREAKRSYGVMPFVLEEVEGEPKTTPRAGLLAVAEQMRAMGLPAVVEEELGSTKGGSGFSDWEVLESFTLMLADGGECVEDLGVLRSDRALVTLLGHEVASAPVGKKFLYTFHDDEREEEDAKQRLLMPSYVPAETERLVRLARVNRFVAAQAQRSRPERRATLDQDATIIESSKRVAAKTYTGERGYQPMVVVWAEQDLIVAEEFRDGNVPAATDPLRVVQRALEVLPPDVEEVFYRGDTASYNHDLMNWLRDESPRKPGRARAIFGIGAVMSPELRSAVVAAATWHKDPRDVRRSWAEVDFVPSGPSVKKGRKPDRYLGIRIEPRQGELFADGSEVKYFAVVTNDFERDGQAILDWHRKKAGTVEHTHHVLKNELGAGVLPCERFGANAAWFRLNVLTYNLLSVLQRVALGEALERARPKRLRYLVFSVAATVLTHARQMILRVVGRLEDMTVRLSEIRSRLWQQTPIWEKPMLGLNSS